MNSPATSPNTENQRRTTPLYPMQRRNQGMSSTSSVVFTSYETEENTSRQAELFYLQKQIQSQTPMVIVLEDGERIEGQIEWYDRGVLKVRGRGKTLVYKSAIRYMYKVGENG